MDRTYLRCLVAKVRAMLSWVVIADTKDADTWKGILRGLIHGTEIDLTDYTTSERHYRTSNTRPSHKLLTYH